MMGNNSINVSTQYDMATATKMLSPYSGDGTQDINIWLRNFRLFTSLYGYPQSDLGRIIICCLQGAALTWASAYVAKQKVIDFEEICQALENRFSSRRNVNQVLRKILQAAVPKSSRELSEILEDANYLYDRRYMQSKDIADMVIDQMPDVLKIILWNGKCQNQEWPEMAKMVLDAGMLILDGKRPTEIPEFQKTLQQEKMEVVDSIRRPGPSKAKRLLHCSFHGDNKTHDSSECRTLRTLKELGWQQPTKQVKSVEVGGDSETDSNNKFFPLYSVSSVCRASKNPFFISSKINGKPCDTLIDTGADINIIRKSFVPKDTKICKTALKAISACGTELKIMGQAQNLPIEIHNKHLLVDAYVVDCNPTYMILGSGFIMRHQDIIHDILGQKKPQTIAVINNASLTVESLQQKYKNLFKTEISTETLCTTAQHHIDTGESQPITQRNFRVPINWEKDIDLEVKKLLEAGIIQHSASDWCSRIVPIEKKDGKLRLCIDFRDLNKITRRDSYPMPRIDEILDKLAGASIFSTLDATSGFHQIALNPQDRHKTAFAWKGGLYEFTRMPFGLCNAPATFQRVMDKTFRAESDSHIIPYFDDIIIFSKSYEEHLSHLEQAFAKLKAAGVSLNSKKCNFAKEELKILGFIIKKGSVKPDPDKVKAIAEFQPPKTVKEMRSFLGTANVFRDFIPQMAHITKPLCETLKGTNKSSSKAIEWNREVKESFEKIKKLMSGCLERAQPDFEKQFILTTDASDKAIGGILSQRDKNGKEQMVHTFSKTLDKAQTNYSVTDKELLAVVKCLEHFRHYLLGKKFLLKTDHKALEYLWQTKNPSSRLLRYSLKLQDYNFEPIYIKGENNPADFLSRPIIASVEAPELSEENKIKIIECYHQELGHASIANMEFAINNKYKWPRMHQDIENYVKKCIICSKGSGENINTQHRAIRTTSPNELWEVDIIGYLNLTRKGNKFILVAIDHYTKWIETKEIKSKDKITVSKALEEIVINRHGAPQRIYSDNGLEFNNDSIRELSLRYGIEWLFNSPGHHNSIGAVERANQTLFNKVKKLCHFGENDWDLWLKQATLATNMSFNRSINTSPYILRYGTLPDLKIDIMLKKTNIIRDRAISRQTRDDHFPTYAERDIIKGKRQAKNDYQVGDKVLVFRKQLGDKLKSDWKAGFSILEKITTDAYIVTDGKSKIRANKIHLKHDASN